MLDDYLVSVIVPVFNEEEVVEEAIGALIDACNALALKSGRSAEIIIVNDGSTDNTKIILESIVSKAENIQLLSYSQNRGKGYALRQGFARAKGFLIGIQDADLEYDPNELMGMVLLYDELKYDVCFGSRFIGSGPHRLLYYSHRIANFFLTQYSNFFTNLNMSDMETCHKIFKKSVLDEMTLVENRFGFEPEFVMQLHPSRHVIYESAISYRGRTYDQGKKIGVLDGLKAIWVITCLGIKRFFR